jgi:hypothetical protein
MEGRKTANILPISKPSPTPIYRQILYFSGVRLSNPIFNNVRNVSVQ